MGVVSEVLTQASGKIPNTAESDPNLLDELLDVLDRHAEVRGGMSLDLLAELREAAEIARREGVIPSTSDVANEDLREHPDTLTQRALLNRHYRLNPGARGSNARIASAHAKLHGNR
jgi:hypothetical protein